MLEGSNFQMNDAINSYKNRKQMNDKCHRK